MRKEPHLYVLTYIFNGLLNVQSWERLRETLSEKHRAKMITLLESVKLPPPKKRYTVTKGQILQMNKGRKF